MKWALFFTLAFLALAPVVAASWSANLDLARGCTTDSDCAARFGGTGGPEPGR